MSDSPIVLAFCHGALPPAEIVTKWNPFVVPLNSELLLHDNFVHQRMAWPAQEISLVECYALQSRIDSDWLNVLQEGPSPNLPYYILEYMELAAPLAILRWTIRRVLDEYTPAVVLIPDSLRVTANYRMGRPGVLISALATILKEETANIDLVVSFTESNSDFLGRTTLSHGQEQPLSHALAAVSRGLANGNVTRKILRRLVSRVGYPPRKKAGHPKALIIGQPDKTWALRRDPCIRRRARFWDYEDLENHFGFTRDFEVVDSPFGEDTDASSIVARYIKSYSAANELAHSSINDSVRHPSYLLLVTDGQHHPLIRQLVSEWTEAGHPAALIPEGVTRANAPNWPMMKHYFITGTKAIRFVHCEADRRFWTSNGEPSEQLVMAGYMGNTRAHSRIGELLIRGRVARARAPFRGSFRGTVFVSFDVLLDPGDLGARWIGAPTAVATNLAYAQLLNELIRTDWFVIAKGRDEHVNALMRQRYRGLPVMFSAKLPWQMLAHASDAVVALTSSIGREAVELGFPVVVWSPFAMPTNLEHTLEDLPPGTVTSAEVLSGVTSALNAVVQEAPEHSWTVRHEDREMLFGSTSKGLKWVRSHLNS